jgi:hypothetical protein
MKLAPVVVAAAMAFSSGAAAEETAQDQQACIGDVLRLCAWEIPHRERVIACVLRNENRLGIECRAVIARHNAERLGRRATGEPAIEQTVSLESSVSADQ